MDQLEKPVSERIQFDDANNMVTIDGVRVDAHVLSTFTSVTPPGRWFRIAERTEHPTGAVIIIQMRIEPDWTLKNGVQHG